MPNPAGAHYDDGITRWDDGSRWDSALTSTPTSPVLLTPDTPISTNHTAFNAMEYWEVTKTRAQQTLAVWTAHLPALNIGGKTASDHEALIDGFEPLVQARTLAQDNYDTAFRTGQDALARMKVLGTKVPMLIEGQLDENESIMKDVDDVYAVSPRAEASILKRLRMLLPVWERANAALAAMTPAQPPISRTVGGVNYTAAAAKTLLDGYTDVVKDVRDKDVALDGARTNLRAHDRMADQLNKRWYKFVKASYDPDSEVYQALSGIDTEQGTQVPESIEIDNLGQGGEEGLQVLVAYETGGGEHATTKLVKWMVVGVDLTFVNSAPLDASGNALGPFVVGQTITVITEVSNSAGSRTSAPRTIIIQPPIT